MKLNYKKIVGAAFLLAGITQQSYAQQKIDTIVTSLSRQPEVSIGFGKQPVRYITSSISTVKGADLQKTFNTNLGNTLYGRLAGLTVNQGNNEPGINSPTLFGRGRGTYGPGNSLLIIIDGFLGDYTQLVPEEVEEISLLKDASATAIYGSRGANGVLLVTTKRGRESGLEVNFSTQQGFSQAISLPRFLNASNYATLYNEALANDGKPALYTPADIDAYRDGSNPFFRPNVDWYKEVLRDRTPVSNYNLSLRGGNSTVKYFVLLNSINSQGLFKKFGDQSEESENARYSRYNFRANMDVMVTRRLSATLLLGGTVEDKASPSSLYSGGIFNQLALLPSNAFPVYNPNGTFGGTSNFTNPVANLLSTGSATSNGRTLQSSFRLSYDIGSGLSASIAASVNNYFISGSNKSKTVARSSIAKNNAGDTVYTTYGQTTSLTGSEPNLNQYRNSAIQAFLNYHRVFGNHDVSAMTMFNSDNSTIDKADIYAGTDGANLSLPYKANGGGTRITYINNNKYIVEGSLAYMSTENYAKDNRLGFFPAVSVGWIASGEKFLQRSKALSFLKLRASYGLVGNDEIGGTRFMFDQRYPSVGSYIFGTGTAAANAIAEGRLVNRDVTWEKEKKANIGLDATFFNHLNVSIDVFNNDRYDILSAANATLPLYLGYTDLPAINQGKVNNKGFEAVLGYRNNDKAKLRFFAETNVFYARNRIDFNAQPIQINPALINVGNRVGEPYGLVALGLFQTQAEIDASAKPVGVTIRPGDVKFQDIGGPSGVPDGIIDGNDSQPIGNTGLPELTVGLHTGLQVKGFDLDLVFQGVSGYTIYLGGSQFRPFQNNGAAGEIALDRWSAQNPSGTFPRLSADNNLNNYRFSSFFQRDGSFVKLRSAEIGYSFVNRLTSKAKLTQARLFITGTNLFSFDRIKYGDPEALGTGYPSLRTITLGARIQF